MKKSFKWAALFMTAVLATGALTACGGDDDEPDGGDGSTGVVGDTGTRLYSVGGARYSYDSKGRCTGYSDNGENVVIDWSKGEIRLEVPYDDDDEVMKFKTNGKGYITEISSSWNETDEGDTYKGSGKLTFSYDKNGHLAKTVSKGSESGVEDGEKYSYEESGNTTFTWTDGNLTRSASEWTYKENGMTEKENSQTDVTYGSVENVFRQYCYTLAYYALDSDQDYSGLALVGMLGEGTANFPTLVKYYDDDDDSHNVNVSVTTNGLGAISQEKTNYRTIDYRYEDVRSADFGTMQNGKAKAKSFRSLFIHRNKKK